MSPWVTSVEESTEGDQIDRRGDLIEGFNPWALGVTGVPSHPTLRPAELGHPEPPRPMPRLCLFGYDLSMSELSHEHKLSSDIGTALIEHLFEDRVSALRDYDWEETDDPYADPIAVRKSDGVRFEIEVDVWVRELSPKRPPEEVVELPPLDPDQPGLFNAES